MAEISATEIYAAEPLKRLQRWAGISLGMSKAKVTDPSAVSFHEDLARRLDVAVDAICQTKGMTRGEVAAQIGVSQPVLSNWTTNQNAPSWYGVYRLCQRFKIPADWVLLGDMSQVSVSLAAYLEPAAGDRSVPATGSPPRQRGSLGRA